ncbi:MAG: nitrous oxide-stimulated promoter family protein [Thiohalocapsa sp.]|uniref:nitrous oxide-stimulated promoter family protein n=1 Tax=Thiohalocapsa sp. TaxID=2497641 RepID=UPI0025E55B91|nr:nitrous oxide-stimulated promoter family protein [Thiohalocapsa sp.]MCG6943663.1 nitrous oxide-stimulated promoter family protein [Thiohalocapsa sp.]
MQMRTQPPRAAGLRPANNGKRVRRERRTIAAMIGIFCHDHHGGHAEHHCDDCADLLRYANQRLDVCVFGESKLPCSECTVHCYSKSRRARIVEVMRYAGPRMPRRHPWLGLLHMIDKLRCRF